MQKKDSQNEGVTGKVRQMPKNITTEKAKPLTFWRFQRKIWINAFSGKFRRAEYISGVFALFAGTLAVFFADWAKVMAWLPFAAFAAAFAAIVFVGLFVAAYRLYDEEGVQTASALRQVDQLSKEVEEKNVRIAELSQPHFVIRVGTVIAGDTNPGTQILLMVDLINQGTPASALASTWEMAVTLPDGTQIAGIPVTIAEPIVYPFPEINEERIFVREDGLDLRASERVERLGFKSGVLIFTFPKLPFNKFNQPETNLRLSVCDVFEKKFSFEDRMGTIMERSGFKFMPNIFYPRPKPLGWSKANLKDVDGD